MRYGYPLVLKLMKKVRSHIRPWMTAALAVFMAVNMLTSALALARYDARTSGEAPNGQLEVFLDEHFDNARMERIYPNAKKGDQGRINPIFPLALLPENRYNILWIKGSKGVPWLKNGCAVLQRQSRQKCPMQHRMLETFITFPRSGQDVIKGLFLVPLLPSLEKRVEILC